MLFREGLRPGSRPCRVSAAAGNRCTSILWLMAADEDTPAVNARHMRLDGRKQLRQRGGHASATTCSFPCVANISIGKVCCMPVPAQEASCALARHGWTS